MIHLVPSAARSRSALDYVLFLAACLFLGVAQLAVHLLPFRSVLKAMDWRGKGGRPRFTAERIVCAVERAAARLPWRSVCIHQGIAAHLLLRLAGHGSQFVYGVTVSDGAPKAHVWVRLGGRIMIGADAAEECAELVALP